jgi:hypothetical protein
MKAFLLLKSIIFGLIFLSSLSVFCQTNSIASGSWNTPSIWSTGIVPGNGTNTNVNHPLTLDINLSPSATYTINAPVTDPDGGSNYNLNVSGILDIHANMKAGGNLQVSGNVIVRSGDTLTIGYQGSTASSDINAGGNLTIEAGGVLIVNGDLNTQFFGVIACDGEIIVDGNFNAAFLSGITGSGTMTTTGTITTAFGGSVFGSTGDCTTGPCSGGGGCGVSTPNTITLGFSVPACSGVAPGQINGNVNGAATFQWQSSTTSATSGFSDISGATAQNYSPAALTNTSWFRRIATTPGCAVLTSTAVQVTLTSPSPVGVSITSTISSFCSGASVTFTATPVNGGTGPSYQWKKNGGNVGTNSNTYTTTSLANGDVVTCILTSNASCITGSPATSNAIAVTVTSGAGSWSGASSTNWNTTGNWCSGARPVAATNVIINGGVLNNPLISTNAAVCNNLTLNAGSTLTVNGNTLAVGGNLVINSGGTLIISNGTVTVTGSITLNSGGTLTITSPGALSAKTNVINNGTISGTGVMTLNGAVAQNISGTGIYGNITLSNALGCTATSTVTVAGILTLTSGTLASGGNLTMDLNTGAIDGSGAGSISGNINTMKTVSSNKYHEISSPLSGRTANDWNDDITIKSGSYANLYSYDETNTDTTLTIGWVAQTSLSTPLTSMHGFALYFYGSTSLDETGTYTHSASYTNSSLTNTVSNTGGTPKPASDGWNLIGNPYPSTIDWSAASGWTKTGLDNAIYFWDPSNDRFASYVTGIGTNGGTRYIPSMQAFWVKVTNPGTGSLAMTNGVRVTSINPSIWRTAAVSDILKLTSASGAYSDETIIRFREDARVNFDSELDAYKMDNENNTPSLYTELNNTRYSINSLPYTFKTKAIPVKLAANFTGAYTFTAEEIASFSDNSIIFEDRLLGVQQDLRSNPNYTCFITQGDTSARFYISFRQGNVSGLNSSVPAIPSITIRAVEDNINIRFFNDNSNKATIGIYTTLGEQVFKADNVDISNKEYAVRLSDSGNGIYIVKATTDTQSCSQKVYLFK